MSNLVSFYESVHYLFSERRGFYPDPRKQKIPEDLKFSAGERVLRLQTVADREQRVDDARFNRAYSAYTTLSEVARQGCGSAYILVDRELGLARVRLSDMCSFTLYSDEAWRRFIKALEGAQRRSFIVAQQHSLQIELCYDLFPDGIIVRKL